MPGADGLRLPGRRIEADVQTRGEALGVEVVQERGRPGHQRRRRVPLGGVGAEHRPQLPHDGGGLDVVPLHVTHHQPDLSAGERQDVVPVAPHLVTGARRAVTRRDPQPRHVLDPGGQHRLLEAHRHRVLLVVEQGPLERLGDGGRESQQKVLLLGGETVLFLVQNRQYAGESRLRHERENRGGGEIRGLDVRPQHRVRGLDLRPRDEQRILVLEHRGDGPFVVEAAEFQIADVIGGIPAAASRRSLFCSRTVSDIPTAPTGPRISLLVRAPSTSCTLSARDSAAVVAWTTPAWWRRSDSRMAFRSAYCSSVRITPTARTAFPASSRRMAACVWTHRTVPSEWRTRK